MGRWVEVVGSNPPRKVLDSSLPDDPVEAEKGNRRIQEMVESKQAPAGRLWNPSWSKLSLGYEVETRAEWEREKARRGLVEISPTDSSLSKSRDLRGEIRKSARKAAEEALRDVKQGYNPPPAPSAPPPPKPVPVENENYTLEELEALARDKSVDSERPHPGYVSSDDLVADMKKRHGWT